MTPKPTPGLITEPVLEGLRTYLHERVRCQEAVRTYAKTLLNLMEDPEPQLRVVMAAMVAKHRALVGAARDAYSDMSSEDREVVRRMIDGHETPGHPECLMILRALRVLREDAETWPYSLKYVEAEEKLMEAGLYDEYLTRCRE